MHRNTRLLQILHLMRLLPAPVRAATLAEETGVSLRTLYRDIEALRAAGARIEGAAGFGYTLTEDPALPPMMFTPTEMEALALGLRMVQAQGDPALADAADAAFAKLRATLPDSARRTFEHVPLYAKSFRPDPPLAFDMGALRHAIGQERELDITYRDATGRSSTRRIRPLSVIYFDENRVLASWCRLRGDFRAFRLDRISALAITDTGFRPARVALLRQFFEQVRAERHGHGP